MRNNTQLMKSAIRNKQQTPAALQMPSWPRGRNISSNIPQQQMPFYFHVFSQRKRMPSPTHWGCGSSRESALVSVTRNTVRGRCTEPANTPVTATALRCEGGTVPQFEGTSLYWCRLCCSRSEWNLARLCCSASQHG